MLLLPLITRHDEIQKGEGGHCAATLPLFVPASNERGQQGDSGNTRSNRREPIQKIDPAGRCFAEERTLQEDTRGVTFEEPFILRPLDVADRD